MLKIEQDMLVRKRDGRVVPFDAIRIQKAIEKAYRAELKLPLGVPLDEEMQVQILEIVKAVIEEVAEEATATGGATVERVQDVVEVQLMRFGRYTVARRYIIYREEHARQRALRATDSGTIEARSEDRPPMKVRHKDGHQEPLEPTKLSRRVFEATRGLEHSCSAEELLREVQRQLYDGISPAEIARAKVLAARARIERDPAYDTVAARLMLMIIYREALGGAPGAAKVDQLYLRRFAQYMEEGVAAGRLNPELNEFDLDELAEALRPVRDELFPYLGLQTIYDRYLLHVEGRRIETPQYFWMRVAMGLAQREGEARTQRAIEFYDVLSSFRFTSATPTLFNAGTLHPQLSSCYLTTVMDDLEHIFKAVSDNAMLSKWAGGLGNDWTNIRATNAHIKGTNGQSQGVIPFLKVVNDAAVAVNQGGKRKGAVCAYLETWHLDLEEFLDLRKNTGDERRRAHDMHTANWIPDLFMRRVRENAPWTLFSPDETPDLHDLVGKAFETRYVEYEKLAAEGKLRQHRTVSALELWRKMLTRLFETGHPWITFKDPSNIRSPQDHAGVVHSSNLCTEILLNTSKDETAVCNLGSINLKSHIVDGQLDMQRLQDTVRTAMRMLDNVIDINFYPTQEAKNANLRHRPVGMGIMGFQDALVALGVSYASQEAVTFADNSMEAISYFAILASAELAAERGTYASYEGSKWDRGLLPIDTIGLLEDERGCGIDMDRSTSMNWRPVRAAVAKYGMRNSNVMAIAPTATISTIIGVTQSIEPHYKHLFVKSNLSGEFTQVNVTLVRELQSRGLWDAHMLEALKYYDGSVQEIDRIPDDIKARYLTAFEVDPYWLIECASRRQKWLDMGQSLNLYLAGPSGKKLNDMYFLAWDKGLKTTYYLRTLAATQNEKSTVDVNKFGIQPRWMKSHSDSSEIHVTRSLGAGHHETPTVAPPTPDLDPTPLPQVFGTGSACSLDGDCEACQ